MSIFLTPGDDDDEPPYPSAEALAFCDPCPVKAECLDWAQRWSLPGIYGGTTSYQRSALRRTRERRGCPGCASVFIIRQGSNEVCLKCGLSWHAVNLAEA